MNGLTPEVRGSIAPALLTCWLGLFACETTTPDPGGGDNQGRGGSSSGAGGARAGGAGGTPGGAGGSASGGVTGSGGTVAAGGAGGAAEGGTSGTDAGPGPAEVGGPTANDWVYSKVITLDTTATGAGVMEDIAKYPVAVVLDKTRFDFTQAQATGADLRFFDGAGKALPHHIELWDRTAGVAAIWVLVDVKGNNKDQTMVMKWGHGSAPDIGDSKAVFKREDGWVGVWHLNEEGNTEPGGFKDASSHEAHGTGVGMIAGSRIDARIGKGQHLDNPMGQNTARWISVDGEKATQFNPGPPITVSLWVQGYSYPKYSYETMMSKGDTSWTLQKVRYGSNIGYQSCVRTPGYHACSYNFAGQALVTKQWLHVTLVLQEPRQTLYFNGKFNSMSGGGPWNKGPHPLGIGNQTQALGDRRQWDGVIDEARVAQVARSAAWVKLEFESQKENPTLLKFGETQRAN